MDLTQGAVVGKYRLESPLAEGGMGSVWRARHVGLGTPVAVKFLAPALAASKRSLARFEREAHATTVIQSPHVIQVHDFGIENDTPYLVMELLEGENLGARLQRTGRLTLSEAAKVLIQIGKALRRAHAAGIVHRDLKPGNVFLSSDDDEEIVKILDFGIAKAADTPVREQTEPGTMLGSPNYVSPEQAAGEQNIDHRSDLWSVAVVLYQAITGELPFQGHTTGNVLKKVFLETPRRVTEITADLPPELNEFFDRALAKQRHERFQTIDELVIAFVSIAAPDLSVPPPSVGRRCQGEPRPCAAAEEACCSRPAPPDSDADAPSPKPPEAPGARETPTIRVGPDRSARPVSLTVPDRPRPASRLASALPWLVLALLLAVPLAWGVRRTVEHLRPAAAQVLDDTGDERPSPSPVSLSTAAPTASPEAAPAPIPPAAPALEQPTTGRPAPARPHSPKRTTPAGRAADLYDEMRTPARR